MRKIIYLLLFFFFIHSVFYGQNNDALPQRTLEHEASKQTERMQLDLNLTVEQVRLIYDINLRYERERLLSNTSVETAALLKKKDEDIKNVLTKEQYEKLQKMRNNQPTPPIPPAKKQE